MKVLIDLHGAPGSQNGFDHSGRVGRAAWYKNPKYRQQTVDVLVRLAARYRDTETVWGVELLNEPKLQLFHPTLRHFYRKAYQAIAEVARPGLVVVFHDAFRPRTLSGALLPYAQHPVCMDHHWYHFMESHWFIRQLPMSWHWKYLRYKRVVLNRLSRMQPIIIGEWSGVMKSGTLDDFTKSEQAEITKTNITAQLRAYHDITGWFYWSYKTEGRGVWNFRSLVEDGIIKIPHKQ